MGLCFFDTPEWVRVSQEFTTILSMHDGVHSGLLLVSIDIVDAKPWLYKMFSNSLHCL